MEKKSVIFHILFSWLVISCTWSQGPKPTSNRNVGLESRIIGEWTIFLITSDSVPIYCNDCPRIAFAADGLAMLSNLLDKNERISWKIENDTLSLSVSLLNGAKTVNGSKYSMKFEQANGEPVSLRLLDSFERVDYFLKKTNTMTE